MKLNNYVVNMEIKNNLINYKKKKMECKLYASMSECRLIRVQ